ncbi:MAG: hypothetical protein JRJ47_14745 [Deltaproteobacteria bacterium]|nr:hypothetical protein [Deltaproteobacteria bacterium]
MLDDIRNAPYLNHEDLVGVNFIRDPGAYVYRRHYRTGLRSHIMEVLDPREVEKESHGVTVDGVRRYPRAEPLKMLRIFKRRFLSLLEAEDELRRVKIIQAYLGSDYVARSEEFLVDYVRPGHKEILLCGLQEYVKGEVLEPWTHLEKNYLESLLTDMEFGQRRESMMSAEQWIEDARQKAKGFVVKLKKMIVEAGYVPDLAGVGNLILSPSGHIKLVDINNISKFSFNGPIPLDDRGYPVCDKSIRVMWLLEKKLLDQSPRKDDPIYETFLEPERMKDVKMLEEAFQRSIEVADPLSSQSK